MPSIKRINKIASLGLLVVSWAFITPSLKAQSITAASLNVSTEKNCPTSTITATFSGTHPCLSISNATTSHVVVGSVITITYTYPPQPCAPVTSSFSQTHQFSVSSLTAGSYTVNYVYGANPSTVSNPLSITDCCPSTAEAGSDTSMCETSSVSLNGNTVPSFSTASWQVITGTGSLVNSTDPSSSVSNLSYGINEFEWTMIDSVCTTKDTVAIFNYETPSTASVEVDYFACYDTITISAIAPIVGSGTWKSLTPGVQIVNKKKASSKVNNLTKGTNELEWTVSNGTCPKSVALLKVEHSVIITPPTVSAAGFTLTSTAAPAYQWYMDNAIISGATNQSYTATANGSYRVMVSEVDCDNGVLSNTIDITTVGLNEVALAKISLSPNPSNGILSIENSLPGTQVTLFDVFGKEISQDIVTSSTLILDLSALDNGIYFVRLANQNSLLTKKILLRK